MDFTYLFIDMQIIEIYFLYETKGLTTRTKSIFFREEEPKVYKQE